MPLTALRFLLAAAGLAALGACASDQPSVPTSPTLPAAAFEIVPPPPPPPPPPSPWARVVDGRTGPGSLYRVYVPSHWNGDLVTMAHPIRDAFDPVTLTNELYMDSLALVLGQTGTAVAYSSYSRNGFAVKDGAQRTHQLRGLATSILGQPPARHFLVGYSLGSAVSLSLMEQYPAQYDGALLLCGMVGGSLVETQYLGHVRSLFDAALPGFLEGSTLGVPVNYTPNGAALGDTLAKVPEVLFAIASMKQTPLPYVPGPMFADLLGLSLGTALTFHARGINDITDLVNGKSPFGNMGVTYEIGSLIAPPIPPLIARTVSLANRFDSIVPRYAMAPSARQYLQHYYRPTGRLQRPVVTVHNRWDPIVPDFHEDTLRQIVTEAGYASNLLQIKGNAYGHCAQLGLTKTLEGWGHLMARVGPPPAP